MKGPLDDAKIRASDEDLLVIGSKNGNVILVSWGNDMYEMLLILFKRAKPQKIFLFSSHLQKSSQIHCPFYFFFILQEKLIEWFCAFFSEWHKCKCFKI